MATEPILVRAFHIPDAEQGAREIVQRIPADWYLYGHFGRCERVVSDLTRMGKRVLRTMNLLHAHREAAGWDPRCLNRFLWDLCEREGLWLRDRSGRLVIFRWYNDRPIYNLAAFTPEHAREVGRFVRSRQNAKHLLVDNSFPRLSRWMFLDQSIRIRDLADYSHLRWLRGWQTIVRAMGWSRGSKRIWVNGSWDFDRQGFLTMYENADSGNQARYFWRSVARWLGRRGKTILSITGQPTQLHTRKLVEVWIRAVRDSPAKPPPILWTESPATASFAWGEKKRAAGASISKRR